MIVRALRYSRAVVFVCVGDLTLYHRIGDLIRSAFWYDCKALRINWDDCALDHTACLGALLNVVWALTNRQDSIIV